MASKLINLLCFQIGWWACVLGAASDQPLLGPAVVLVWTLLDRLILHKDFASILLLPIAGLFGYLFDSALVLAGVFSFPSGATLGGPSPLWMTALWINLAATMDGILSGLQRRYALSALVGFIGGPVAYYAGHRLGAINLSESVLFSLSMIALQWLIAMPLLFYFHQLLSKQFPNAGEAAKVHRRDWRY